MADLQFKYLNEVDIADNFTDFSYVFIEDAGEIKRVHKDMVDGRVKTVNGIEPDVDGNIQIELSEINYPVTSVNGMTGDVEIVIPEQKNITVNGIAPDENGNIEISSTGGVFSWNDLIDKPFYEESGNVIEWDGQTSLNEKFNIFGDDTDEFVKINNLTLSYDELINSKIFSSSGDVAIITESNASILIRQGTNAIMLSELMLITYDTTFTFDAMEGELFSCPGPGIYMNNTFAQQGEYLSKIIYNYIPIKTLNEKFIPDMIARKNDIVDNWNDLGYDYSKIVWDGTIDGKECYTTITSDDEITLNFYKISDTFFSADQLIDGVMMISGVEDINSFLGEELLPAKVQITEDMIVSASDNDTVIAMTPSVPLIISVADEFATSQNINISKGTYALLAEAETMNQLFNTASIGFTFEDNIFLTELKIINGINQIPEKFIPNTVIKTDDLAVKGTLLYSGEITTEISGSSDSEEEWISGANLDLDFSFEDNKNYIIEINGISSIQQVKNGHTNGSLMKYMGNFYGYMYNYLQQEMNLEAAQGTIESYYIKNLMLSGIPNTEEDFAISISVNGNNNPGIITKLPQTFTLNIYEDGGIEMLSSYLIPENIRKSEKLFIPGTVIEYDPCKEYDESTIGTTEGLKFNIVKISDKTYTMEELIGQYYCLELKEMLKSFSGTPGKFADLDIAASSDRIDISDFIVAEDNSYFILLNTFIFVNNDNTSISEYNVTLSKGVWISKNLYDIFNTRIKIGFSDVLSDFAIPETCARVDRLYWDFIKNKPFYDEISSEKITLDFDGSFEDKNNIVFNTAEFGNFTMVKISDDIPQKEQLKSKTIYYKTSASSSTGTPMSMFSDFSNYSTIFTSGEGYSINNCTIPTFVVVTTTIGIDSDGSAHEFSPGIWVGYESETSYISSLEYAKEIITHQLDEKYIPEIIARTSDISVTSVNGMTGDVVIEAGNSTVNWNDIEDKPFYDTIINYLVDWTSTGESFTTTDGTQTVYTKVSDLTPTRQELFTGNGQILTGTGSLMNTINLTGMQNFTSETGCYYDVNKWVLVVTNTDFTFNTASYTVAEPGIYFFNQSQENAPVVHGLKWSTGELATLDEKFIPDTIARVSDISTTLPVVTTEQNGAFLRVIDGVWTVAYLTDVSSEGG